MTLEQLIAFIAAHTETEEPIVAETTFESLGLDSLSTVELVMQLEEEADLEIDLDEKVLTVGDLYAFIDKKRQQA